MGVKRVSITNRSTKGVNRRREQKKRWFRNGQKWRTGCEGRISVVKRRHGLDRCRYKGDARMKRWVGLGVIADIGRAIKNSRLSLVAPSSSHKQPHSAGSSFMGAIDCRSWIKEPILHHHIAPSATVAFTIGLSDPLGCSELIPLRP